MEQSKFSGALKNLKKSPVKAEDPIVKMPPVEAPVRGRGRPRAKSSNPEYQSTTVILRKTTKRRAAHLLEDKEMGKDLSELIEELLMEWLAKHAEM
jgi:hypothetical protein